MLKKNIAYTDYNGNPRKEDFYFNLTKAELMEMELGTTGGMTEMINKIVAAQDTPTLMKIFKDFIMKSYGVKSADGKRFIKSEELSKEFIQTEAYSVLFMELLSNPDKANEFMSGIIPADTAVQMDKVDVAEQLANGATPSEIVEQLTGK